MAAFKTRNIGQLSPVPAVRGLSGNRGQRYRGDRAERVSVDRIRERGNVMQLRYGNGTGCFDLGEMNFQQRCDLALLWRP
jgi:hypothetical protein